MMATNTRLEHRSLSIKKCRISGGNQVCFHEERVYKQGVLCSTENVNIVTFLNSWYMVCTLQQNKKSNYRFSKMPFFKDSK